MLRPKMVIFAFGAATALAACQEKAAQKSLQIQYEEMRAVGTWQPIGVVRDDLITRTYVVNTRTGVVCEYEHLDSQSKPGERFSLATCEPPPSLHQ